MTLISRFLDPKNNYAFLKIFGTEKNKDILIHFLNDILGYTGEEVITEVTFLKTNQDPDIAAYRQSIVDVLCKDKHGTQFIVEMQVSKHPGFEKRAQLYAAKAYSRQILKEDENHKKMAVYAKLRGVIFLAIADFILFPDKKDWRSNHRLLDTKTYENDLQDFYFIFLELEKFNKELDQLENLQEKCAYFFKHAHESTLEEMESLIGHDFIIKKAFYALDQASWSEEELNTYEKMIKTEMDNLAVEEQKIMDAKAKGEARGETKGEARQKISMAKKMLAKNRPLDEIMEFTDLTEEEIEKLK
ncbi:MAG: Rpn family recombination-promoting nuclease/putative transposase [Rickettsia sp.]|uniref:Rpn family recombination-promoting nuclease/putative transposase n=1 Tax=Rickettsia sp. TaxID=789 RepID=UPI00397D9799